MDAARLNFSHGSYDDHGSSARLVRQVQGELGRPLALIADLQGPKLRLGVLPKPRLLVAGEEVILVGEGVARDGDLPVAPSVISEVLRPGNDVLINDGRVRLAVQDVHAGRAQCLVIVGGEISSHKGVNLPGVAIPVPSLTRRITRISSSRSGSASTSSPSRSSAPPPTFAS